MSVDVVPSAAFGLLRGEVVSVDPYPVTSGQALGLLGNDVVATALLQGGPVRLVHVRLQPDSATHSGYAWTTKAGPPFPVLAQSMVQATVRVSSQHPINLIFGH